MSAPKLPRVGRRTDPRLVAVLKRLRVDLRLVEFRSPTCVVVHNTPDWRA